MLNVVWKTFIKLDTKWAVCAFNRAKFIHSCVSVMFCFEDSYGKRYSNDDNFILTFSTASIHSITRLLHGIQISKNPTTLWLDAEYYIVLNLRWTIKSFLGSLGNPFFENYINLPKTHINSFSNIFGRLGRFISSFETVFCHWPPRRWAGVKVKEDFKRFFPFFGHSGLSFWWVATTTTMRVLFRLNVPGVNSKQNEFWLDYCLCLFAMIIDDPSEHNGQFAIGSHSHCLCFHLSLALLLFLSKAFQHFIWLFRMCD